MTEIKRRDEIAGDIVHVYDGIEEADNELPAWWVAVFVGSIVFAGAYWLMYEEYHAEPSAAALLIAEEDHIKRSAGAVTDEDLDIASKQASFVVEGKAAFVTNCVVCHGEKGEGKIGVNLTDNRWLHGGAPMSIYGTIRDGVPAKGMPSWGAILGPEKVKQLAAFVLTLRNTNVPGKEPQGEPWTAK
jgi:cytochrome c oxidase cbb3-type subunit III